MIDFPASPTNGQQYSYDGRTWEFDAAAGGGVGAWNLVPVSTSDADTAAESAVDAIAAKNTIEALVAPIGDLAIAVATTTANATVSTTKADLATAAALAAEIARDAAIAGGKFYATTAAAQADAGLAVNAGYVAPLSDGSLQAYRKDSSSASTAIGLPFSTSVAVAAAAIVAARSEAYIGPGYTEIASVKGVTTPDTTTLPVGYTYGNGIPTPSLGRIPNVHVRVSGPGTGEVHYYTPSAAGFDVAEITPVTVVSGVNVLPQSATRYWPAGTYVHYKAITSGRPRYVAGGLGSTVNNTEQVKGTPLAGVFDKAYGNTVSIAYDFVGAATATVDARLGGIESGTSVQQKNIAAATGVTGAEVSAASHGDTTPNTSTITPGYTYGNSFPMPASGYLESFSVRLSGAGTGRVIVYEPVPGGALYEVAAVFNVTAAASGVNTFSDFGNLFIKRGAIVHYSRITGGYPRYVAGGVGSLVIAGDGSAHTVGTQVSVATNSNTMGIAYTLRAADASLLDRIEMLDAEVDGISVKPIAQSRILEATRFPLASLPAGWTASGWTVNDGLTAPVAGGWDVVALAPNASSLAKRRVFARIKPSDTTGVFGICSNQTSAGLAALIDGSAGKLRLYSWLGSAVAGTLVAEVALPAALVAGRSYLLDVRKDGFSITVAFTDTVTLLSATLTSTNTSAQLHGRTGVMQVSGAPITVDSLDHLALYPSNVRAVLLGDSNLEGTALQAGQSSWGYQLAALRSEGDVAVAGRAGDTTPNFMVQRRVTDLQSWASAKYVVIALGTNDTNHASWRTNIATMIADAIAIGAEPILCTMLPRPSDQAVKTLMNTDIRGHYFGRYRYIDFATALSVNQDSVTWDALYQTGDNVHANLAGQQRMLQQVLADAPYLIA